MVDKLNFSGNWTHTNHQNVMRHGDFIVAGWVGSDGYVYVGRHNTISKESTERKLYKVGNIIDDHNAPTLAIDRGGSIHIFFTGHNLVNTIYYYICREIESFEFTPRTPLTFAGNLAYATAHTYNTPYGLSNKETKIMIVAREGSIETGSWVIKVSLDTGKTWSAQKTLVQSPSGYLRGRGANPFTAGVANGFVNFGWYFPEDMQQDAYFFRLDLISGDISLSAGTTIANIFTGVGLPLTNATIERIYTNGRVSAIGTKTGSTMPVFMVEKTPAGFFGDMLYIYHNGTSWVQNTVKVKNTMAWAEVKDRDGNVVYLAGEDGLTRYVDRLVTTDSGATWTTTRLYSSSSPMPIPKDLKAVIDGKDVELVWLNSYFNHYVGEGNFSARITTHNPIA